MANYDNIKLEINTNLPDNNSQLITAQKLRDTLIDFVDAVDATDDSIEGDIAGINGSISGITGNISVLSGDVANIKDELLTMNLRIDDVDDEFDVLEDQSRVNATLVGSVRGESYDDYTEYDHSFSYGDSNWYTRGKHVLVEVSEGEKYALNPGNMTGYVGYLSDSHTEPTTAGSAIAFANRCGIVEIPIGVYCLTIPTGVKYLCINTVNGSNYRVNWVWTKLDGVTPYLQEVELFRFKAAFEGQDIPSNMYTTHVTTGSNKRAMLYISEYLYRGCEITVDPDTSITDMSFAVIETDTAGYTYHTSDWQKTKVTERENANPLSKFYRITVKYDDNSAITIEQAMAFLRSITIRTHIDVIDRVVASTPISNISEQSLENMYRAQSNSRIWDYIYYEGQVPNSVTAKINPLSSLDYSYAIGVFTASGTTALYDSGWQTESGTYNIGSYQTGERIRLSIKKNDSTTFSTDELEAAKNGSFINDVYFDYPLPIEVEAHTATYKELKEFKDIVNSQINISGALYDGAQIQLSPKYRYNEELFIEMTSADYSGYTDMSALQSGTVYGNYIFLALSQSTSTYGQSNSDIIVMDKTTKEIVTRFNFGVTDSHSNNIEFTDIFYNEADEFPLALISPCNNANGILAYVVRILKYGDNFNGVIVNTIYWDKTESTTCSYDVQSKTLWAYYYKNGAYNRDIPTNTMYMCGYKDVDLLEANLTVNSATAEHKFNIPWVVGQGMNVIDGKIYFYNTTESGKPTWPKVGVWVINTGTESIESIVPIPRQMEAEGICIYDGEMWLMDKNTTKVRIKKLTF